MAGICRCGSSIISSSDDLVALLISAQHGAVAAIIRRMHARLRLLLIFVSIYCRARAVEGGSGVVMANEQ